MAEILMVASPTTQAAIPASRILQFHADRDPNRPCISIDGRTVTRAEFEKSTNRLARVYMENGVVPGDLVMIAVPNGIELCEAIFAAWKCGAVPNPVSWRLPKPEVQGLLDLGRPALLVGGEPGLGMLRRIAAGAPLESEQSSAPLPEAHISPFWKAISSGGSTGLPKIIVSHKTASFDPLSPLLGQSMNGSVLIPGPLYNNGPFMGAMLGLFSGNHVILMSRFDELQTLEHLDRYRVDWTFLVPTMMNRIWRLGEEVRSRYDLSHLNIVFHSASVCPVWLKAAWIDWLGPEKILEGYGGTESQGVTFINGIEWQEHPGSVGRAMPGSRIVILDPSGQQLPPGEVGEIFFLPDDPGVKSYHYIGAERREVGAAGSVGDMGYLDEEGWLYIADRRTDMIVTGGANVYPAEVESALDAHSAIRSSIVIGLPDDDMVAKVHAIIQLDPDAAVPTIDELKTFLKTRIVPYKIPRSFEFVAADLRDDAGKARRIQLREERIALQIKRVSPRA